MCRRDLCEVRLSKCDEPIKTLTESCDSPHDLQGHWHLSVMPSLSFSPVVGERVVVCVGPESQPSCVQTIHFTASFPSQQAYDEYRRDRVRVELWTNVPTAENKSGGQGWVALPFRERDAITPEDSGAFALLPETPSVKTLHLEIPVPRSGNSFVSRALSTASILC